MTAHGVRLETGDRPGPRAGGAPTRFAALLLLLPLLLAFPSCAPDTGVEEVEFRIPVSAAEVELGTVEDRVVATGRLRSLETASLTVPTDGILEYGRNGSDRRLAEGDRVEAGQTLATITGAEVSIAARTRATTQRYRAAQENHEASRRLFEEGLISEIELNKTVTELAEARLEWERSLLMEERTTLVSPISGVIMRLARDENGDQLAGGQLVPAGLTVAEIASTSRLLAEISLLGTDVARVEAGDPVRLHHHAWPDRIFSGEVTRLAPGIDPQTQVFRAEVTVAEPVGPLRPGMFVKAEIVTERHENVPVIPRAAVTERNGQKVVFTLDGQRAAQRPVALGFGDDTRVEVRSGVEAGERIVVRGLETLTDGARVRISGM